MIHELSGVGSSICYAVTLNSDGSLLYDGGANAPRLGVYSGRIAEKDWKHVSDAFTRDRFFEMKDKYMTEEIVTKEGRHLRWFRSDQMRITTIVTCKDGSKKTVCDYGGLGPQTLWELENVVQGVTSPVEWTMERPTSDRWKNPDRALDRASQ